jgi:hypothetical protein
MGPVTDHQIWLFAQGVQKIVDKQKLTGGAKIEVSYGRRYAKIIKHWGGQIMSWGYVDRTNGDVRRGSWKGPDMRVPPHGSLHAKDMDLPRMLWTGPPYHK